MILFQPLHRVKLQCTEGVKLKMCLLNRFSTYTSNELDLIKVFKQPSALNTIVIELTLNLPTKYPLDLTNLCIGL